MVILEGKTIIKEELIMEIIEATTEAAVKEASPPTCTAIKPGLPSHLWHSRLGHPSNQKLQGVMNKLQQKLSTPDYNVRSLLHCKKSSVALIIFNNSD
ncbi:hypothetical protein U1Q18_031697 [Sarracenia purpurea var. burkii]